MKKVISLLLLLVMVFSITAGINLSVYASEKTLELNNCWVTDNITELQDTQCYMITLKNDCHIEISLMHYFGARIQLYNDDISECILNCNDAGGNENTPVTNTISGDFNKGNYYIKITGYLGWSNPTTGKYKIKGFFTSFMNNETEPNDFDNAMCLNFNQLIIGAITLQDQIDWFKINSSNNGLLEVSITHYFGVKIEIFNDDLSECILETHDSGGSADAPITTVTTAKVNKGMYYIKITGYLGWSNPTTGKYKLKCLVDHSCSKEVVTKATVSKDGNVVKTCTVCGKTVSTTVIPRVSSLKLSTTNYVYNGKVKAPAVTVKDRTGKTLVKNTDYTVSYASGRKNVGKYNVKITFKGNYSGTITKTFTIKPKNTSISSVSAKSKGFTVKWKKQATQTTGYEIQYATDSKFTKNKKTVIVSKNSTTSKTISKLSAKKKYYVRIRTYKTVKVNGKSTKIYSSWSKAKYVTTKK